MIRIAICDDEKNIRTYLSSLVRKQNIECEITEYASTDEYLSDQKEHDLLFLDIEMKSVASGMDGMSMAKQIRATELTKQPIIIFVTGYEKYVYDAFDVGAFQYLFLIESVQSGQDRTNISAFQPMGVSAYEDTISTFSKSVIESQKL